MHEVWYGDRRPGLLLRSLEHVYSSVAARRRRASEPAADLVGKPIIVVGNITAGGTGKTPLVIRLCELARSAGLAPAVVSRGYGRSSRGAVTVVATTPAAEAGDEPALIARLAEVTVHVDADREAAARAAFAGGADLVIADDGLQRLSLPRELELCVVDGARGFGNGRLLPAGPLREPVERLQTVDAVVSNGPATGVDLPADTVSMTLTPRHWLRVDGSEQRSLEQFGDVLADQPVHAMAAIGHPERFFLTLESLGIAPGQHHVFPDHHAFAPGDFSGLDGVVLMTEKDAVKCAGLDIPQGWALAVQARLPEAWESSMVTRMRQLTSKATEAS